MKGGAGAVLLAMSWAALAAAQSVDQVPAGPPKGTAPLAAVSQVATPTGDRLSIAQVDPARRERRAAQVGATAADGAAEDEGEAQLAPRRIDLRAIDADEIARVLASGEATRIDAAAAIADADARKRAAALEDSPDARKRDPRAPLRAGP